MRTARPRRHAPSCRCGGRSRSPWLRLRSRGAPGRRSPGRAAPRRGRPSKAISWTRRRNSTSKLFTVWSWAMFVFSCAASKALFGIRILPFCYSFMNTQGGDPGPGRTESASGNLSPSMTRMFRLYDASVTKPEAAREGLGRQEECRKRCLFRVLTRCPGCPGGG